jgi:hypothetical protein
MIWSLVALGGVVLVGGIVLLVNGLSDDKKPSPSARATGKGGPRDTHVVRTAGRDEPSKSTKDDKKPLAPASRTAGSKKPPAAINKKAGPMNSNDPNGPIPIPGLESDVMPRPKDKEDASAGVWLQDLDQARTQAAQEKKDILILFGGSDWSSGSLRLAREVFSQPKFLERVRQMFVLVSVDFPRQEAAQMRVENAVRNAKLQEQFRVEGYPLVVLADAEGRHYGVMGYQEGGADKYRADLVKLQEVRARRDQLFAAIAKVGGVAQLVAAGDALTFLQERDLVHHHLPLLEDWLKLASQLDPCNQEGHVEFFFESLWQAQAAGTSAQEMIAHAGRLDDWKKKYAFQDPNRAGRLHLVAGFMLARAGWPELALPYFKDGLALKPTDAKLIQTLTNCAAALGFATGSGFVVGEGGEIVTNNRLIAGPGKVLVRWPGIKESVTAEVVAQDEERDLALLRIKPPAKSKLRVLTVAGKQPVQRGDNVAVLGHPLGGAIGTSLQPAVGAVRAPASDSAHNLHVLDAQVNPGTSGGPLCDPAGNVVGMMTARSFSGHGIDSYGLAIPAQDVDDFLQKNFPKYKPAPWADQKKTWDEVSRMVTPGVVLVLKTR